jgi:hypothetical protein
LTQLPKAISVFLCRSTRLRSAREGGNDVLVLTHRVRSLDCTTLDTHLKRCLNGSWALKCSPPRLAGALRRAISAFAVCPLCLVLLLLGQRDKVDMLMKLDAKMILERCKGASSQSGVVGRSTSGVEREPRCLALHFATGEARVCTLALHSDQTYASLSLAPV